MPRRTPDDYECDHVTCSQLVHWPVESDLPDILTEVRVTQGGAPTRPLYVCESCVENLRDDYEIRDEPIQYCEACNGIHAGSICPAGVPPTRAESDSLSDSTSAIGQLTFNGSITWDPTGSSTGSTPNSGSRGSREGTDMECVVCEDNIGPNERSHDPAHQRYEFAEGGWLSDAVCRPCWRSDSVAYCPRCDSYYHTDGWGTASSGAPQVCESCSISDDEPLTECDVCGEDTNSRNVNGRGVVHCGNCWSATWTCIASYCGMNTNPNHESYDRSAESCVECEPVRSFGSPPGHPGEWDFDPHCRCSSCRTLADSSNPMWEFEEVDSSTPQVQCTGCNAPLPDINVIRLGPRLLCHTCADGNIGECGDCGESFASEDLHEAEARPDEYCDECMRSRNTYWFCAVRCNKWFIENHSCSCDGVHQYNYRPPEFDFFTADTEPEDTDIPYMGVELEIEGGPDGPARRRGARQLTDLPWAYPVHDGSLAGTSGSQGPGTGGEFGFEVVTHPFSFDWFIEHWSEIKGLLSTYQMMGFRSWDTERCGMHIHVSRGPMSQAHQWRFVNFIYGSVNLALVVGQRSYKSPGIQQYASFTDEDRSQLIRKIRNNENPGVRRHYAAISTTGQHTLENRWFRGTLNPISFRKNVEFIHSVWRFTRKYGMRSSNEINYMQWLRSTPECRQYSVLLDFLEREYVTRR